MMKLNIFKIFLLITVVIAGGCKAILDPDIENVDSFDRAFKDPAFAEGILMNVYSRLPTALIGLTDVATDDAVTNDQTNIYTRMANGQWSAQFNPVSVWDNAYRSILYINELLPQIDTIPWSATNANISTMFKARLKGEAYGLRGIMRLSLLQAHGGKSAGGKLLGYQLFDNFLTPDANFNLSRADFAASINAIYADFDKAAQLLPMDFVDVTTAAQMLPSFSTVKVAEYNLVFGRVNAQRLTRRIVLGYKSRASLLAASPAFSNGDATLWATAARDAGSLLKLIGGAATGLDANGHKFYEAARVDAVTVAADQKEMLWRGASNSLSNTIEKDNLPPSLNGNGRINPTQNLVDAFPMKNGYPITDPLSLYDPINPYANRDPRLAAYIVHNKAVLQTKTITTGFGGGVDAKDSLTTSTRTGYYLRKLIREDIIFSNDGTATTKKHYTTRMRYTELFLNYAEAANEAWGPTGVDTLGFSAKDVILALRKRAGITQPDVFATAVTSKEAMRQLIQNERRLELCFEGFRFWDLRRWGSPLSETAKGIKITGNLYETQDIEKRIFKPTMQYGPIPYSEIVKFSALEQNAGY